MADYTYTGDVNPEYGGAWIDLSTWDDGYCSAVRVTDLDSGCGFTGAVLIEHVVINGTDQPDRIRKALASCGNPSCRGMTKAGIRLMIAEAMMEYGCTDPDDFWDGMDSHHTECVQMESDGPMRFDGWKADKRLRGGNLRGYVEAVHLK